MTDAAPAESIFQRVTRGHCKQLTHKDDLSAYLVLLVQAVTDTTGGLAGESTAAAAAAASVTPVAAQPAQPTAPNQQPFRFDVATAAHVFQLLGRYPQTNRISKYIELDASGIWDQVKRQSRYALTTLSDAEKSEQDSISFERGDQETRVRLVLSELRQVSRNLRRKPKNKSTVGTPMTPIRPPVLSRIASLTSAAASSLHASANSSAPQFLSPLLTNELFADELQHIVPVLFLRCRNAAASSRSIDDDDKDSDSDVDMSHFEPDAGQVTPASSGATPVDSPFIPLLDLVHVLLHQGPVHGARLLTLLAATKPLQLSALLDATFQLLQQHLTQLRDKLHSLSTPLVAMLHQPAQLSAAALTIWQHACNAVRSSPFTTLVAFLVGVSKLAPSSIGLFVRLRISKLMETLKLAPPTLTLPSNAPATPATAASSSAATAASPAPTGLSNTLPMPSPPSTPGVPPSGTPSRARSVLPAPVNVAPRSSMSSMSVPASYVTPSFIASILTNSWSPLTHFLPSLALGITVAAVQDEVPFLTGVLNRLNLATRPSEEKSASHLLIDYMRDCKMGEEYIDVVMTTVNSANASAANAATAALHAQASKARATGPAESESGRKRKGADSARPGDKDHRPRMVGSVMRGTPTLQHSTSSSGRAATPSTSPSMSALKSSSTLAQGIPSMALGSPQKHGGPNQVMTSPTLHSVQMRELLLTPGRKGHALSFGSSSTSHPSGAPRGHPLIPTSHPGSVDALRSKLASHVERLRDLFDQQVHSVTFVTIPLLSDLVRIVKLYSYLLLYCNFFPRQHTFEQLLRLLPAELPVFDTKGCRLFLLISQLEQFLLIFFLILPQPSTSQGFRLSAQFLTMLERMKRWMNVTQVALRRAIALAPSTDAIVTSLKDAPACDNLLLQVAACGHVQRPTDLVHLLRSLLRLPAHFRPALLSPYVERVPAHLKEIQHVVSTTLWPKSNLLNAVFLFDCNRNVSLCMRDGSSGMHVLRSSSPFFSVAYSQMLTNAAHLLRSNTGLITSHVPRPFFECQVGFWAMQTLLVCGRRDSSITGRGPLTSSLPSLHPLITHPSIFPLLDSLVQFDLSTAILDQQHLQPVHSQQHKPAQCRHDTRLLKENEMADLLALLLLRPDSFEATPGASVQHLPNPIGLCLTVYYLLSYNALVMRLWSKSMSLNPGVSHEVPQPTNLVDLPPPGSKESSANYLASYTQLGLPSVPFYVASLASAVSIASAVHPYPPHLMNEVPLRGCMEYLKALLLQPPSQQQDGGALHANLTTLFFHLYRLLWELYPEALIGLDFSGLDSTKLEAMGVQPIEGSLVALGVEPQAETMVVALPSEDDHMTVQRVCHSAQMVLPLLRSNAANKDPILVCDTFFLCLLRPLALRAESGLISQQVVSTWFRLYSSSLSSTEMVYHTLLTFMPMPTDDQPGAQLIQWRSLRAALPFNEMLLDPFRAMALLRDSLYSAPGLLRIFLTCLFHLLVASTSHVTLFGKAEHVSAQIVRQATYQSNHAAWLRALRLMANGVTSSEKRQMGVLLSDPIALTLQREVEQAAKDLFANNKTIGKTHTAASGDVATPPDVAKAAKKAKKKHAAEEAQRAASKKGEDAKMDTSDSTLAPGAPPPRPYSFLVSDRMLTVREQQTFSSEFALGTPEASSAAVVTPSLRAFLYLLSSRAAIVQELLSQSHRLIAAESLSSASDATLASSLSLVFAFLRLVFHASTAVTSSSPSSLFLLVHVQSYPAELLPLFFHEFSPLVHQLLDEPLIKERITSAPWVTHAEVPDGVIVSPLHTVEQRLFIDLLLMYSKAGAPAAAPSSQTAPSFVVVSRESSAPRLSEIVRCWLRIAITHPQVRTRVRAAVALLQQHATTNSDLTQQLKQAQEQLIATP